MDGKCYWALPVSEARIMDSQVGDGMHARDPHQVTLLQLCNDVLRRRWSFVAVVAFWSVGSAVVRLAQPRSYTSVASFAPETARPEAPLATSASPSLAGLPGGGPTLRSLNALELLPLGTRSTALMPREPTAPLDPAFYYQLLGSRQVLAAVAESRFTIRTPTGVRIETGTDLLGVPAGAPLERIDEAARRLSRGVEIRYDGKTNVLTMWVRTHHPDLSRAVAERLLAALTELNRRISNSRAEAQVAFLTRAVAEARSELRVAEDKLARFLESNRAFVPASRIALEYQRRDADVLATRRRHADLALQLERAKLERSRVTQMILVVGRPETPALPDSRGLVRATVAGAVGGVALALLVLLTSAHLARLREAGSAPLSALSSAWRDLRGRRAADAARTLSSA